MPRGSYDSDVTDEEQRIYEGLIDSLSASHAAVGKAQYEFISRQRALVSRTVLSQASELEQLSMRVYGLYGPAMNTVLRECEVTPSTYTPLPLAENRVRQPFRGVNLNTAAEFTRWFETGHLDNFFATRSTGVYHEYKAHQAIINNFIEKNYQKFKPSRLYRISRAKKGVYRSDGNSGATQGAVGGASAQGAVGGASAQGAVGGASAQGAVGGASAQGAVGGALEQGAVGGASAQGAVGGASAQGAVGGALEQGAVGGASAQGAVGGAAADERGTVAQDHVRYPAERRSRGIIRPGTVIQDYAFTSSALNGGVVIERYSIDEQKASNKNPLSQYEEEILFVINTNEHLRAVDISGFKLKNDAKSSGESLIKSNARFRVRGIQDTEAGMRRRIVFLDPITNPLPGEAVRNPFNGTHVRQ